jgi:hypothetical protein
MIERHYLECRGVVRMDVKIQQILSEQRAAQEAVAT